VRGHPPRGIGGLAPRIREDKRWPRYVPAAVELGLKSQLAVKLYKNSEGTLGA
jgi:hypothetical protein